MIRGENMGLRDSIRRQRERERTPEVFAPDDFTRVAAILKAFGLDGETFLKRLDEEPVSRTVARALGQGWTRKTPMRFPPFALVAPESFAVLEAVVSRVQSPYLPWAESPEDLLLCRPLYALHPTIAPPRLARYTFAFLYRFYTAGKEALEASHA